MRLVNLFLLLFFLSYIRIAQQASAKERLAKFLQFDYNITNFPHIGNVQNILPIQDTSNDTVFTSGIIPKRIMKNITMLDLESYVTTIKDKRWLPINDIRKELTICLKTKYNSYTTSSFKYDKGMHGWFTLLKVSCLELDDNDFYFAIAYYRSRFRLKQVFLRRQNSNWATSGRNLMSRDIQKMINVFSLGYKTFVELELEKEMKTIGRISKKKSSPIINISKNSKNDFNEFFFENATTHTSKGPFQSFETVTLPYSMRLFVVPVDRKGPVLDDLTEDLDGEAYTVLGSCTDLRCDYESESALTHNLKTKSYMLGKVRAQSLHVGHTDLLLSYESSKPSFKLSDLKKRTGHGVVDVQAQTERVLVQIWETLLQQLFVIAMKLHSPGLTNDDK